MKYPTKRELIQEYTRGHIKPVAIYPMGNKAGLVILDFNGVKCFGYKSYGQEDIDKKDYFYVDVKTTEDGQFYITVSRKNIYMRDWTRMKDITGVNF